jgi:sporulation protein YlmC with PRC-barrel domain
MAPLQRAEVPVVDLRDWRQQQIAAAQPVTDNDAWFQPEGLMGTEVRSPQGEALGSVSDLILAPHTGKIAYLVIARGGIFGLDKMYVPVPWQDFKMSPTGALLVLDSTKLMLEAAPSGHESQFAAANLSSWHDQEVDAYWKAHIAAYPYK